MKGKALRLAIISDLHCHPSKAGDNLTYLPCDQLRSPSDNHPVESLLKVIEKENISVDYTLCPGDFTEKASVIGFISGWNYSLEIHRALKSEEIVATLGNHDVDSHNGFSTYSLDVAKGIKQGFPINSESERDIFWSKGCVFLERDRLRILLINSSHYHHNKLNAGSGKVGEDLVEYIDEYLEKTNDDKIFIVMSHHHPIDHSRLQLGEDDKIVNADPLLNVLGKYNIDLFIHGHKHDPLMRYYNTTQGSFRIPIFSSGSFSSSSNLMFTSVRNCFHIIEIEKEGLSKGKIKTWTYLPHRGWKINFDESGFAPFTGFGTKKDVDEVYQSIIGLFGEGDRLEWSKVEKSVADVSHLVPDDSKKLSQMLKDNGYILDEPLGKGPTSIYNTNSK